MEYACKVAGSKIIAVLGHTQCGAIKSACDHVEMGHLTALLSKIRPAIDDETTIMTQRNSSNNAFVEKVTFINVKRTMKGIIKRSPILKEMLLNNDIKLVSAIHELSTGEVTFCENT